MVEFKFRGLIAPVFTPFHDDEQRSLNLALIPNYASYLKQCGINGILVNGTTGEGVSQTVEEREAGAEAWMEAAKTTKQTIMVQVGGTNLKDVCRLATHAEKIGASSILCLADLFHQPRTADDLLFYLAEVGKAAPKTPLLYYHIPAFTGIDINMREMLEGADKVPTLVGLKFTCNDLNVAQSLVRVRGGKYCVFLGSDTILSGGITLGLDSAISTSLNLVPQNNINVVKALAESDLEKARVEQKAITAVIEVISRHGSWVGTMKSAMRLISPLDVGPVRRPLRDLDSDQIQQVTRDLQALKVL